MRCRSVSLCPDKSGLRNLFVSGNKKGVSLLIDEMRMHLCHKEHYPVERKSAVVFFRMLYMQTPVFLHLGQNVIKPVPDVRGREFDQA